MSARQNLRGLNLVGGSYTHGPGPQRIRPGRGPLREVDVTDEQKEAEEQVEVEVEGIEVEVETRPFEQHSLLLDRDTPDMWTLAWSADYPHAHDFLGLLLQSGSSANVSGWSQPEYDALVESLQAEPAVTSTVMVLKTN